MRVKQTDLQNFIFQTMLDEKSRNGSKNIKKTVSFMFYEANG